MGNLMRIPYGKNNTFAYCAVSTSWGGGNKNNSFKLDYEIETIDCCFCGRMNNYPDTGSIQCSTDGSSWTTIFSGHGRQYVRKELNVKGKGYKFIKAVLNRGNNGDNSVAIISFAVNTKLDGR